MGIGTRRYFDWPAGCVERDLELLEPSQRRLRVINVERCENPLPESEIEKIADSAGRYDPAESLASETSNRQLRMPIRAIRLDRVRRI